ncbi:ribose 5-phosphate isomerase RpiB [Streptomyces sp. MAA16]|nr:ribose 5-phosphate isomerase RpiB [Streptomyces sp. MAA16]
MLALSLRLTSEPLLKEILDAWFEGEPSQKESTVANVARVRRADAARATA